MKVLLAYLVLTIVAVIYAFALNGSWSLQESSSIALFWCWYNILVLSLTCLVCIEQPRKRKAERLLSGERVAVCFDGELRWYSILDISTSGLRIQGIAPGRKRPTGRADDRGHCVTGPHRAHNADGLCFAN